MKKLENAIKKLNSPSLSASGKGPKALIAGLAFSDRDYGDDAYELGVVIQIGKEAALAMEEVSDIMAEEGKRLGMNDICMDIPKCMKVFGYNPNVEIEFPDNSVEWEHFPKGIDNAIYGSFTDVDDEETLREIRRRARTPEMGYGLLFSGDRRIRIRMKGYDAVWTLSERMSNFTRAVYRYAGDLRCGMKYLEKPEKARKGQKPG